MRPLLRSLSVVPLALLLLAGGARVAAEEADPFGPARRPPPRAPAAPAGPVPGAAQDHELAELAPWLARDDWLCRALAAQELRLRSDEGAVRLLATTLGTEADPRVLATALRALAGRPREDLLVEGGLDLPDRLLLLAAHPHPLVAARARAALSPIPPVRLGEDLATLRAWWSSGRDGLAVEIDLALARRDARRQAARGAPPATAADAPTSSAGPGDRWRDLDRIHREGLDFVVCLDQTGSMDPVIEAAKAGVKRLLARLRLLAPRLRVGLVTYDDDAFLRTSLTPEPGIVEQALRRITANGGGDEEEGVDRAIALALRQDRMGWGRSCVRVIVVVGDAPPHEEDVDPLLSLIRRARGDPLYDEPIRLDTISTLSSSGQDERVPHFVRIAAAGGGTARRLESAGRLADELLLLPFGPAWRAPLAELIRDLDLQEAAAAAARPREKGR